MRILKIEDHQHYLDEAIAVAKNATCERAKCGTVIVSKGEVIGAGFNSPPGNIENEHRCHNRKDSYNIKVTDKTCCIHAEQRAIIDALKKDPDKITDSRLYFVRLTEDGDSKPAGSPYCTICSKMALDVGISEFILWHEDELTAYGTEEYNRLSFEYQSER